MMYSTKNVFLLTASLQSLCAWNDGDYLGLFDSAARQFHADVLPCSVFWVPSFPFRLGLV